MEAEPAPYPSDADDLARLSPHIRALIYLRLVEGHCYDDISAMLHVSASSARMTVSRALRILRSSNLDSSAAKERS